MRRKFFNYSDVILFINRKNCENHKRGKEECRNISILIKIQTLERKIKLVYETGKFIKKIVFL